jgi:hypothetical protein
VKKPEHNRLCTDTYASWKSTTKTGSLHFSHEFIDSLLPNQQTVTQGPTTHSSGHPILRRKQAVLMTHPKWSCCSRKSKSSEALVRVLASRQPMPPSPILLQPVLSYLSSHNYHYNKGLLRESKTKACSWSTFWLVHVSSSHSKEPWDSWAVGAIRMLKLALMHRCPFFIPLWNGFTAGSLSLIVIETQALNLLPPLKAENPL